MIVNNTDIPIVPCPCTDDLSLQTIDPVKTVSPMPAVIQTPIDSDEMKRAVMGDVSLFFGVIGGLLYLFG